MNKQRKTSHILNVFQYDETTGAVTLPASLSLASPDSADNSTKVATTAWIREYVGSLGYATSAAVTSSLTNYLTLTGGTLSGGIYINPTNTGVVGLDIASNTIRFRSDSLEGFKRQLVTTLSSGTLVKMLAAGYGGTYVTDLGFYTSSNAGENALPNIYLTGGNNYVGINTVTPQYNLDVAGTGRYTSTLIASSFVKSGGTSAQFLMADGSVSTNPGWLTGITSSQVTTALGYTPYNSSNPAGYITASALSPYLPLSGGNMTGNLRLVSISGNDQMVENTYGAYLHLGGWAVGRTDATAVLVNTAYRADYADALFDMNISRFTNNSGYITSSALSGYLPLGGGTMSGNLALADNKLYLRTNGDENHYLWNASDDWEEMRFYGGTGFRIQSSNGGSMATFTNSGFTSNGLIRVNANDDLYLDYNYGCSVVGVYSSTRYQGVFSMGNAYKLARDGSTTGNLYGLAWSHPNAGGIAGNLNTHGLLVMENGTFLAAISGNIKARDGIIAGTYMFAPNYIETNGPVYATIMYDNNDRSFYVDPNSTSRLNAVVYNDLKWAGDQSYGFLGRNVYADTINGRGSDPLEINYYDGGDVRIGSGVNGSKGLYAGALYDAGSRVAISRGEGRNYVDYSRYVYNNGAYSGSGWIEPSDLGVRYAASSNYSNSTGSLSGFDKTNPSFGAVYASNWFRAQGDCGLYSQDYGGHLRRNTESYGTWEMFGYNKNGWGGFVVSNNYVTSHMHNSSGDFGFLTTNGAWWNLFYSNGNNCWGIGTDNTYSGDGFRCIKYGSAQYGWTTWSDRRAKENISSITGALDTVLAMRGVYFNYIQDEAKNKRVGFIAQELESVLPEAVRYAEEIDEYSVEYAQIVSVLAEAIKEQDTKMKAQDAKIQRLEQLLQQLTNQ